MEDVACINKVERVEMDDALPDSCLVGMFLV